MECRFGEHVHRPPEREGDLQHAWLRFVLLSCCFAGDVAVVEVATKTVVEFGPFWI